MQRKEFTLVCLNRGPASDSGLTCAGPKLSDMLMFPEFQILLFHT